MIIHTLLLLRININMNAKFFQQNDQMSFNDGGDSKQALINGWKMRSATRDQRKQFQRRIFGQHYNYSKVGLNKEKKYMIEEQKNTEIQRENRILLQKIQRIAKRSVPFARKRAITQQPQQQAEQELIFRRPPQPNSRNFNNSDHKSTQQLSRMDSSNYNTPRQERKYVFRGMKEAGGKLYAVKTYPFQGKYVVEIELGSMNQKIKIDLDQYKVFFRDGLEKDHAKIIDFLQYDGKGFELRYNNKQQALFQQDHSLILPLIESNQKKNSDFINF